MKFRTPAYVAILYCAAAPVFGQVPLVDAARKGEVAEVRSLIKQRADVNAVGPDGSSALLWATYRANPDMVRALIGAKANVNVANQYGITPLLQASRMGNAEIIAALLKAGADAGKAERMGETPLMAAAGAGNLEAVKLFIAKGADVNAKETVEDQTALMWAASEGHLEVVKALLAAGANPNVNAKPALLVEEGPRDSGRAWVDYSRGGLTPLMYAARGGHLEVARVLAEAGADLDFKTPVKVTATILAVLNDHTDLAAMLLDKGADPNDGALHETIQLHNLRADATASDVTRPRVAQSNELTPVALVAKFLEHGADPDRVVPYTLNSDGNSLPLPTPVDQSAYTSALRSQDVDVLRAMVAAKAVDPNAKDKDGVTPLMTAITGGGIRLNFGQVTPAPFRIPGERSAAAAVKFLVEAGADVNIAAKNGDTPLHRAAQSGDVSVIKLLADSGAKLDAKNAVGFTALDVAMGKKAPGAPEPRGGFGGPPRGGPKPEAIAMLQQLMGLPATKPVTAVLGQQARAE